jgi:hypothetical protein
MKTLAILVSALTLLAPVAPCASAPVPSAIQVKQVDPNFQPRYATLTQSVSSGGVTLRPGTSVLINVRWANGQYGFIKNGTSFRVSVNQFRWQ